jgi:hypothetical protein
MVSAIAPHTNTDAMVSLREVMAALLQAVEPHIWLMSLHMTILESP